MCTADMLCTKRKHVEGCSLMHAAVCCRLGKGNGIAEENHSSDTLQLLLSNRSGMPRTLRKGRHPRHQLAASVCIRTIVTLSSPFGSSSKT